MDIRLRLKTFWHRVNTRKTLLVIALFAGCGPTTHPMVIRPTPEQQEHINEVWNNMLTPHDRLDRTLLLDVLITNQMHQLGVDELELTSYKQTENGWITMRIRYDREYPDEDEFEFVYEDNAGIELCHHVYSREEIEERLAFLFGVDSNLTALDQSDDQEFETEQSTVENVMHERQIRMEEIKAATQPAEDY